MSWRKIGSDSIYVTVGTVATQLLQWIILTSIARVQGAGMLGLYALGQAFALPLQYLAWLSIRQRYLTLKDDDTSLHDFIFLRFTFPVVVFLLAFVFIYFFYLDRTFVYLSGLQFIAKYIEGFYDLMYAVMQKESKTRLIAKLSIVRTIASGSIFVACYISTKNIFISMLATSGQQALLLFFIARLNKRAGGLSGSSSAFERTSVYARLRLALELLPVSLSLMVMSLNTSVPRLLLNGMVGAKELGYFAAVGSFISLGAVAVGSLGQSLLQPLSSAIRARQQRTFWLQLMWPMLIIVAICLIGALITIPLGPYVLRLVYGAAFVSISPLLFSGAVASAPIFAASVASIGVFAAYLRNAFFWSQLAAAAFSAVGVVILVPTLHIQGVFLALGLSGLLQILISFAVLYRFWSGSFKTKPGLEDVGNGAMAEL